VHAGEPLATPITHRVDKRDSHFLVELELVSSLAGPANAVYGEFTETNQAHAWLASGSQAGATGRAAPDSVVSGAQSPILSSVRPRPDHPEWDVAAWLDMGTLPVTPGFSQFYTDMETWDLGNPFLDTLMG
jgi:Cholesterol oxidase, substrate-binding